MQTRRRYIKERESIKDPVDYNSLPSYILSTEKGSSVHSPGIDLWVDGNGYVYELSISGEFTSNPTGRLLGVIYEAQWTEVMNQLDLSFDRTSYDRKVYRGHFEKHVRQDWVRGKTTGKPDYADRLVLVPPLDPRQTGKVNIDLVVDEIFEFTKG